MLLVFSLWQILVASASKAPPTIQQTIQPTIQPRKVKIVWKNKPDTEPGGQKHIMVIKGPQPVSFTEERVHTAVPEQQTFGQGSFQLPQVSNDHTEDRVQTAGVQEQQTFGQGSFQLPQVSNDIEDIIESTSPIQRAPTNFHKRHHSHQQYVTFTTSGKTPREAFGSKASGVLPPASPHILSHRVEPLTELNSPSSRPNPVARRPLSSLISPPISPPEGQTGGKSQHQSQVQSQGQSKAVVLPPMASTLTKVQLKQLGETLVANKHQRLRQAAAEALQFPYINSRDKARKGTQIVYSVPEYTTTPLQDARKTYRPETKYRPE